MDVLIFAHRHGNELSPLNQYYCPAMLPVGNKAVIDYTMDDLSNNNIKKVKIIIAGDTSAISNHLKRGEKWGVDIEYFLCKEQESISHILKRLTLTSNTPLLLIQGDTLRSPCLASFLTKAQSNKSKYIQASMQGKNAGIVLSPNAKSMANDLHLLTNNDSETLILKAKEKQTVTITLSGKCYPINNFGSLVKANLDLANLAISGLKPTGRKYVTPQQSETNIYLNAKTNIDNLNTHNSTGIIGQSSQIASSITLKGTNVIGSDCVIDNHCHLENSLIMPNTYVGQGLDVIDAILCHNILISIKNNVCIQLDDPVILSHNSNQESPHNTPISDRILALFGLIITGCLSPIFMIWALLASPLDPIKQYVVFDNNGKKIKSWQWNLPSPLFSQLPVLIHVLLGKLDLFGYAPQTQIKDFEQFKLDNIRYGLFGPVQFFLKPSAPEEEKSMIEATFKHTKGKKKYISLIWNAIRNSPQIN
ncbi:NDP-sugar synthase [uncultured Shewanella sp.]|uniref:nucleotidyltransferase family protein n=1 Tax=uncultured Shewanella sp. TaxID=173975 RepID=UPI002639E711|nr:NDP-sugar synthase [uncultured Shewanella sp.]